MRKLPLSVAGATVLFALAGCGATGGVSRSARVAFAASAQPVNSVRHPRPRVRVVRIIRTAFGPALADRRGFALYVFTRDRSAVSTCYGACAAAWPPYEVAKRPLAVEPGAHAKLLGTVLRSDGRAQVTYGGHPVYYFVGDTRPGDVLCQGAEQFGGIWYVVAPDGRAIH